MKVVVIKFICDLLGVPVLDVYYFKAVYPSAFIRFDNLPDLRSRFLITVGPFVVCSILSALFCLPLALSTTFKDGSGYNTLNCFLLWVGIAIGLNAFPSIDEVNRLKEEARRRHGSGSALYLFAGSWALWMQIAGTFRFIWWEMIYVLLVAFLPTAFFIQ